MSLTSFAEYPAQKAALDGTGITEAVCLVHKGKPRTVPADALKVAGATDVTALRCYQPLSDAEKKKAGAPTPGATSLPSREFSPGASDAPRADKDLCQEMLVPLESYDAAGNLVRRGGKRLEKPERPKKTTRARGEEQGPEPFEAEGAVTGGEKVSRSSGAEQPKGSAGAKKSARSSKSTTKKSTASSKKKTR